MVAIFRELRRVLRKDGTLWLNLGSSMWGGKGKSGQAWATKNQDRKTIQGSQHQITGMGETRPADGKHDVFKPKDMVPIPWMVAMALQQDGWWLRSDIIWHKPNPMPESVTDRPTKAHEYVFLLTKAAKYYYDAEAIKENFADDRMGNPNGGGQYAVDAFKLLGTQKGLAKGKWNENGMASGRNKRTVWTIPTKPFPKSHFATYPPALVEPCILAGTSERGCCSECGAAWKRVVEKKNTLLQKTNNPRNVSNDGKTGYSEMPRMNTISKTTGWKPSCKCNAKTTPCIVLDIFGGACTTAVVAHKLGRKFVMIELSKSYIDEIGIPRIEKETEQRKLW